jgi:hypothetical protein
MSKHTHYWSFDHAVWEGRKEDETGTLRWCSRCGKIEMAFTSAWGPVPRSYVDARRRALAEIEGLRAPKTEGGK